MATTHLNIATPTATQKQKEVTSSGMIVEMDRKAGRVLTISIDDNKVGDADPGLHDGDIFSTPPADSVVAYGPFYFPHDCEVSKLTIHKSSGSPCAYKPVIYEVGADGTPGDLVAEGDETTATTNGDRDMTFTTPPSLTAGWYYLGLITDYALTLAAFPERNSGLYEDGLTYASGAPDPWAGTLVPRSRLGINATYTRVISGDITLTEEEARYKTIEFTGTLTANVEVIVPNEQNEWMISNQTSGAFNLDIKTAAGNGTRITSTSRAFVFCDGTDVFPGLMTGGTKV